MKERGLGELVVKFFLELLIAHQKAFFVHPRGELIDQALLLVSRIFLPNGVKVLFEIENIIVVKIVLVEPT